MSMCVRGRVDVCVSLSLSLCVCGCMCGVYLCVCIYLRRCVSGILLLGNVDIKGVEEEGEESAAKIADEAMFEKVRLVVVACACACVCVCVLLTSLSLQLV
eukprot:GHVU01010347.1.p3 GENE.GHVU01010347.1~~GHVU01010347.1.p3  ORF type:complete len:101 (-),score=13.20 GHVU01010347.1:397-699(-)